MNDVRRKLEAGFECIACIGFIGVRVLKSVLRYDTVRTEDLPANMGEGLPDERHGSGAEQVFWTSLQLEPGLNQSEVALRSTLSGDQRHHQTTPGPKLFELEGI